MKRKASKNRIREKYTAKQKVAISNRCRWLLIILSIPTLLIFLKLTYTMVFKADKYSKMAEEQWVNEIRIEAKRGKILDRNGNELAISGDVYRVDLDLTTLNKTYEKNARKDNSDLSEKEKKEKEKNKLASELANILKIDKKEVLAKLNSKLPSGNPATSAILARRVEKEVADKIKDLKYYGIIISSDTKRYYPNGNFSSYILGNVNSDIKGLNGVELTYDSILSGVPGVRIAEVSKGQDPLPLKVSEFTPAIDGKNVVLTIDEQIQYFVEKIAKETMDEYKAESVNILVMEPNTGEVLAAATTPDYDPNKPYEGFEKFSGKTKDEKIQQMWRDRIVSDTYEPGSTFKVMTLAAAIEEGVAGKGETYYCNGYKVILGTRINCWNDAGHGPQTFSQILENSCNVGLMEVAFKLGKDELYKYIKEFGFGELTGIDLPGESKGIVMNPENMSDVDLATVSFGQANTANMLQLLTAFNATVNGGLLVEPHVMKEISHTTDEGADVIDDVFKPTKKRVISEETSKQIRTMVENVVTYGTGKSAYLEEYRVGGKTGTAQMVDSINGGYGKGRIASFIATAPANNPKVSILVKIENPKSSAASGGAMGGPVVKKVLEKIFNNKSAESLNFDNNKNKSFIVPEVRGMTKSKAEETLKDLGINVKFEGKGDIVSKMDIIPGSMVKSDSNIVLKLTQGSRIDKDIIVPNMIGFTKQMAEDMLKKIGLKGEFDKDKGVINKQSINKDTIIKNGDTIKFILQE